MAAQEIRLRLSENGRVVIPIQVRKELGVEAGERFSWSARRTGIG